MSPCVHDLEIRIPAVVPLPQVIQSFQHILISLSWGQLLAAGQVLRSLSSLVPRASSGMLAACLERFQVSQSSGRSCLPEQPSELLTAGIIYPKHHFRSSESWKLFPFVSEVSSLQGKVPDYCG